MSATLETSCAPSDTFDEAAVGHPLTESDIARRDAQELTAQSNDDVTSASLAADSNSSKRRKTGQIATQCIGLTYAQCPAPTKFYLDWLTSQSWWQQTDQYVIARERHQDGNFHLHVAIKRPAKGRQFRFKGSDAMLKFDITYEGTVYHPNIITKFNKGYQAWDKYCKKEGDYISNGLGQPSVYHQLDGKDWEEVRPLLLEHAPRDLFMNADRIKSNVALINKPDFCRVVYFGPFIEAFYPTAWQPDRQSLVLTGPAGIGKTQFACFLASYYGDFLLASQMDDLKRLSKNHKTIVFDDMDFGHLPRSTSIMINDIEVSRSIYCRYGNANIPAGVKRIFTTNRRAFTPYLNLDPLFVSDPAVERRVYEHVIE